MSSQTNLCILMTDSLVVHTHILEFKQPHGRIQPTNGIQAKIKKRKGQWLFVCRIGYRSFREFCLLYCMSLRNLCNFMMYHT